MIKAFLKKKDSRREVMTIHRPQPSQTKTSPTGFLFHRAGGWAARWNKIPHGPFQCFQEIYVSTGNDQGIS